MGNLNRNIFLHPATAICKNLQYYALSRVYYVHGYEIIEVYCVENIKDFTS